MKILTYNVHKCRGLDGRVSAERVGDVLESLDADIIALQEVFSSENGQEGQLEYLARRLGSDKAFGRTRYVKRKAYGNGILSRWPIVNTESLDISREGRERRGCLRADIETPGGPLHVFNIHMGTSYFERRHQVRSLLSQRELEEDLDGPRILAGDFNEWLRGLPTRLLAERFESLNVQLHIQRRRTYPGLLPFLHLDHIYFEKPLHVVAAELVRNPLSLVASDHLPLVASFRWQNYSQSTSPPKIDYLPVGG